MGERVYYVYMLARRVGGTLYIGVTNDLVRRVYEHREKLAKGFTAKYDVGAARLFRAVRRDRLCDPGEKQLKKWKRAWKVRLLEEKNPNWDDLYPTIAAP